MNTGPMSDSSTVLGLIPTLVPMVTPIPPDQDAVG